MSTLKSLRASWKLIVGTITPFLLLPLIVVIGTREARCAYVIILMAIYWILEPIPMAATSLLPVALFPLFGVMSTAEASTPYMKEFLMLFVGGLMVAIAVETSNLHQRIALSLLLCIGTSARRLMLGFMIATAFLSMWISNVATTAMMVPILEAVLQELGLTHSKDDSALDNKLVSKANNTNMDSQHEKKGGTELLEIRYRKSSLDEVLDNDNSNVSKNQAVQISIISANCTNEKYPQLSDEMADSPEQSTSLDLGAKMSMKNALFLSIAYSANIGGTGTLTGTGPNIILKGVLEEYFPTYEDLTFASWMFYNVPTMIVCIVVAWLCLQATALKCCECTSEEETQAIRKVIQNRYRQLGPMKFQEGAVLFMFTILVGLWIFRDPQFMEGWSSLLYSGIKVSDASTSILIALLMFFIPSDRKRIGTGPRLLDWKTVQTKMPWSVIILLGGGFSLAEGVKKSGLSEYMKGELMFLESLKPELILVLLLFSTAMLTEVISNTAMATIFTPVMCQMAVAVKIHPLYLSLPVTIACSFAFILPVATPPNAIVYERSHMKIIDMVKPGLLMNILCCCVELMMIHVLGPAIFDFKSFQPWSTTEDKNLTTTIFTDVTTSL